MNNLYIFPTDTLYALACRFDDVEGYKEIVEIKKRDPKKLLPVLASSIDDLSKIVDLSDIEKVFINKFLPGPLTLVVKVKDGVNIKRYGNEFATLAIRIPNHRVALNILKEFGPMFATSLNTSGEPPLFDEKEIIDKYGSIVSNINTDSSLNTDVPSTIISINEELTIIREGQIKKDILINEYNKLNLK